MSEQGLKQSDLAKKSSVGQGVISRLLSGESGRVTDETASKIAAGLGIPLEQLCRRAIPIQRPKVSRTICDTDCSAIIRQTSKVVLDGLTGDIKGALSDIGDLFREVSRPEIGELGWILLHRSMCRATGELIGQSMLTYPDIIDAQPIQAICGEIQDALDAANEVIDDTFFRRPAPRFVANMQSRAEKVLCDAFRKYIESDLAAEVGLKATRGKINADARQLAARIEFYFHSHLQQEFDGNPDKYSRLVDRTLSVFDDTITKDLRWIAYDTYLQRIPHDPVFDETFSHNDVFVPLHGFYEEEVEIEKRKDDPGNGPDKDPELDERAHQMGRDERKRPVEIKRHVLPAIQHLTTWLTGQREQWQIENAIRFIRGEPGRGKSTLMRMHARELGEALGGRAVLIPLHRLQFGEDLGRALDQFCEFHQPPIPTGLLSADDHHPLLLIFDGLDELEKAGRAGAEAAREFVATVSQWVQRHGRARKLSVLFCGRPISVDHATLRCDQSSVFHLLPYFLVDGSPELSWEEEGQRRSYVDPDNLLRSDLRPQWWRKFTKARGLKETPTPAAWTAEESTQQMNELTAEPLLSYFVGLAYLDDTEGLDLKSTNALYAQMIEVIKTRPYMRRMEIAATATFSLNEFEQLLEYVALVAYHHSQRHVTIDQVERELPDHLAKQLMDGRGSLKSGLFRLMVGFFAQLAGTEVFEFTHKSFAEYLTARAMIGTLREINTLLNSSGTGRIRFEMKDALVLWCKVFGPTAITFDLNEFLRNELQLLDVVEVKQMRETVVELLEKSLDVGLPLTARDEVGDLSFKQMRSWSDNCEQALIVMHSNCVKAIIETEKNQSAETSSEVKPSVYSITPFSRPNRGEEEKSNEANEDANENEWNPTSFSTWLRRQCPQRKSERNLTLSSLHHLNLCNVIALCADLRGVDLHASHLSGAKLSGAKLSEANLSGADLSGAHLSGADLSGANLSRANLSGADLSGANLSGASGPTCPGPTCLPVRGQPVPRPTCPGPNCPRPTCPGPTCPGPTCPGPTCPGPTCPGPTCPGPTCPGPTCPGPNCPAKANLFGADLSGANLSRANLSRAHLSGADLSGAEMAGVKIKKGILSEAQLESMKTQPQIVS